MRGGRKSEDAMKQIRGSFNAITWKTNKKIIHKQLENFCRLLKGETKFIFIFIVMTFFYLFFSLTFCTIACVDIAIKSCIEKWLSGDNECEKIKRRRTKVHYLFEILIRGGSEKRDVSKAKSLVVVIFKSRTQIFILGENLLKKRFSYIKLEIANATCCCCFTSKYV